MVTNNKQPKWSLKSSVAFVIWYLGIIGGLVFTGFKPAAQYMTFALFSTMGLGLYIGKRLFQKRIDFNNLAK